jgi:exopolysaccharide production protein ExoY
VAQAEISDGAAVPYDVGQVPSIVDWFAEDGWAIPSLATRVAKRTMDIVLSLVALIVVLPLLLVTLLVIVLEGAGSPLYVQRRVGRYGAPFGLIKLRTMARDADERLHECLGSDSALSDEWQRTRKLRADPRVTRIGRFLRRWSLDEVPQLLNVLAGQMSLVGPRPVPPHEGRMFGQTWPFVLSVRPGLTGLWAVSGRSELSYAERVSLEAAYVRDCNVALDLRIMIRTVPWVLRGRGSY